MLSQLPAFVEQSLRLALWLAALCLIFIPLERALGTPARASGAKQWRHNLVYYFLSSLLPAIALSAPLALAGTAINAALPAALIDAVGALPWAVRVALGFLVGEIGFYWGHRLAHRLPFLWRYHALHHSAEHMYFLVHTRAHPIDLIFTRLCGILPLYVVGLAGPTAADSALPLAVLLFGTFWGFFIHSNVRLRFGPLEALIATPFFHHWHHQREDHQAANFASTLPLIDRVFGTYHTAPDWPPSYGIDTPVATTLAGQLADPLGPAAPARQVS